MALAPDIVAAVAQRLAEHAGLELPAWVVEARAAARMSVLGVPAGAYVELIRGGRGGSELAELVEAVRVGESRLFRHRAQIAAVQHVLAPAWLAAGRRSIRAWSAGCAAGEEPYTLASVLSRALPDCAISIVATDVSADALRVAKAGRYPANMLAHVPEDARGDFALDGDAVVVRPELAALVRFERANLVDGIPAKNCDLVWCRNVLIYFTPDARRRAIERLVAATSAGGFVFAGYSESLRDVKELDAITSGDATYYVKRAARVSAPMAIARPSRPRPITVVPDDLTPAPVRFPPAPPPEDVLALHGHPNALRVTAELSARFAIPGLTRLAVDLDAAELLGDDLAPVLRRARAAATAAGVSLELRATRPGARRWLGRHGLDDGGAP